ncbi:MAG: hypothetical protein IT426_00065 [Pirellulales bacterium]|nr:hypothetical protein [Pirellulales bacterium]
MPFIFPCRRAISHKKWMVYLLFLALFPGCGAHESSVTGKVTLDGIPLNSGTAVFYPRKGGAAAYGSIQPDGSYKIETGASKGLAAGEYAVTVVAATPPEPGFEFGKLLTPVRYGKVESSDLKFTIQPGSNIVDLPLKSK